MESWAKRAIGLPWINYGFDFLDHEGKECASATRWHYVKQEECEDIWRNSRVLPCNPSVQLFLFLSVSSAFKDCPSLGQVPFMKFSGSSFCLWVASGWFGRNGGSSGAKTTTLSRFGWGERRMGCQREKPPNMAVVRNVKSARAAWWGYQEGIAFEKSCLSACQSVRGNNLLSFSSIVIGVDLLQPTAWVFSPRNPCNFTIFSRSQWLTSKRLWEN